MTSIIYAKRFLDATAALAPRDRKAIDSAVMEFARGSKAKGLRLHKLNCRESRFYSISANEYLRIIVLVDGDTRVVMHAGHHDATYRWAERHEVRTHERTKVPQIIEYVECVEERVQFIDEHSQSRLLFDGVEDELLSSLGVPLDYIRLVRKVRDEDDLERLSGVLPEEAWEALVEIAAGAEPELLAAELAGQNLATSNDVDDSNSSFSKGFSSQSAKRRFWVADSEEALQKALAMPWAAWRVFLHPSQSKAVATDHSGPARITGGAGTGKSVVLVHRAVRLVRKSTNTRVFLSTFSKALAQNLATSVDELIADEPELRARIEVAHLHEYAYSSLRRVEPNCSMATNADIRKRLESAATETGYLAHPLSFLRDEWNHVVDYWGVESLLSYLSVARAGRGRALPRAQRELLWPVFQHVLDGLERDGALTRAGICQRAADLADRPTNEFDHVLLDEVQDFGPRELQYAHSLAGAAENALFLGGDDGQRIYRNPFSLKAIGINIRGRSRRLRVNYRTSAEIHDFSVSVLPEEMVEDGKNGARRVTSLFGGVQPQTVRCQSHLEEAKCVLRWLEERQKAGIELGEIALLARQQSRLSDTLAHIENMAALMTNKLNARVADQLVADTLHAAKGLEFKAVAVVGVEEGWLPLLEGLDGDPGDEAHALALDRERHLLYVGCTRARESLLVTYIGNRSRFLPKDDVKQGNMT